MPTASDSGPFCWRCGGSLGQVLTPWGRRSECPTCHAPLHVCRMCRHYDTGKAKQCREPVAEPVLDKTRANFCDWFQPGRGAPDARQSDGEKARASLDALFGGPADGSEPESTAPRGPEDLFKP